MHFLVESKMRWVSSKFMNRNKLRKGMAAHPLSCGKVLFAIQPLLANLSTHLLSGTISLLPNG